MDDFRSVLMILGVIAVAALVIHGIWTVRKDNQDPNNPSSADKPEKKADKKGKKSKSFSLKGKLDKITPEKSPLADSKERVEPNIDEGQLEMELPEDEVSLAPSNSFEQDVIVDDEPEITPTAETTEQPNSEAAEPEEVLILNVMAPEGQTISGAALLPFLLTLGFKYGDMAIFHRYEESSGSGAVLFSLANMFNPGTFDIDNMETFSTQGLSLFMSLPVDGEATQVFNMMHNAAKKLAAEFNGQVLDGQRSVLTRQTVQHYVERIREYERRQLLKA